MEEKKYTWGGKRPQSGRKPLPKHLKRLPRTIYLNEKEYEYVKEIVRCLKMKKKEENG